MFSDHLKSNPHADIKAIVKKQILEDKKRSTNSVNYDVFGNGKSSKKTIGKKNAGVVEPEPDETKSEPKEPVVENGYTFNPAQLIDHFTMMIYGARRVGKTHLATYIISKIKSRFEEIYLFSQTIDLQPDAWKFIPDDNKRDFFDEKLLEEIINKQKTAIDDVRAELEQTNPNLKGDALRNKISENIPNYLLVLDDIINDASIRSNDLLSKLFISGRHLRFSLIFLAQTPAKSVTLSRVMRTNVDYCLTSEMDTLDDLETVASLFFGKEGKKRGIEKVHELSGDIYSFAVSAVHKRGKKTLEDHTTSIMAPSKVPDIFLRRKEQLGDFMAASKSEKKKRIRLNPMSAAKSTTKKPDAPLYFAAFHNGKNTKNIITFL